MIGKITLRRLDLFTLEDAAFDCIPCREFVIGEIDTVRPLRHLVHPILSPSNIADDAHLSTSCRQRRPHSVPRFLLAPSRLVHDRRTNIFAVEVVRIIGGSEPDLAAAWQHDPEIRIVTRPVRLVRICLNEPLLYSVHRHLRLLIHGSDPPVRAACFLIVPRLRKQPHQASCSLACLGCRFDHDDAC